MKIKQKSKKKRKTLNEFNYLAITITIHFFEFKLYDQKNLKKFFLFSS